MTTKSSKGKRDGVHAYEVQKIEVLDEKPNTSNGRSNVSDVFVSGVKLLKGIERSYDPSKKILMRSDGFSLFAEKTGTRKNGLYVKDKKGKESKIEGDYPKWRSVIPTKDTNSSKVDVQSLRDFLASVKANNAKDFRDGKARVIIRTDYGDYLYNAKLLSQVADFMEKHGIDELQFEGRYGKTAAQNKSAIGLLMPMFFEGTGLEELEAFGYDIRTDKGGERFSLGDSPESFDARRERAVREKGTVMPGLKDAEVRVVDIPRHKYTGNIKEATQQAIEAAKAKYAPNGEPITLHYNNYGAEFDYSISGRAIAESLNPRQQAKSSNKGIHLAVAEHLDEVINNSIEVEEHPDYEKNGKGERDGVRFNNNALMHRFYGTISNEGKTYRVMILMREDRNPDVGDGVHAYEVQKIEVLDDKTSSTPNGVDSGEQIDSSYPLAKILKDVEKSYDPGKKILDASLEADNSQARFSLPNEREDKKPVFYSNAQRAVESIRQEKATPEQWLAMIQKQGGLKAAEDKWLGLSDWLESHKGKSLTKQEVLDYIRENDVQVEEVEYGEYNELEVPEFVKDYQEEYRNYYNEAVQDGKSEEEAEDYAWSKMLDDHGDDFALGFTPYGERLSFDSDSPYNTYLAEQFGERLPINSIRLGYTTQGLNNKREIALTVPTIEPYNDSDLTHFGDAGEGRAVVWVRFGETKDADGNRVLVIDEIQSKRHQDGREKGYKSDFGEREKAELQRLREDSTAYGNYLYDKYIKGEGRTGDFLQYANGEERQHFREIQDKISELEKMRYGGVPDAPFEKNWHELAMKRMLRYAAENGYDKVAWTTGTQQAERYDIGNVVEDLYYKKNEDGRYTVSVTTKNVRRGNGVRYDDYGQQRFDNLDEAGLQELVGKEVATKIIEGKGRKGYTNEGESGWTTFKGKDLRIGGEGMKGFYDQILPRFMDKYGKKWGVKTGMVELPLVEKSGRTMHAVDVTPEMRESVMQGQPKFSLPSGEKGDNRRIVVADYARRGGLDDLAREISLNRGAKDERAVVMLSKTSPDERRLLKESISKESNGTLAELAERAKDIESMPALKIKAEPISMPDFENIIHGNGDEATIADDGMRVLFSNKSLNKLYNSIASETGAAKNLVGLICGSKYAYSQPHNNTGKLREDGTKHPNRENILEYRNYVNKFENENGTYYCRFIVMRSTDGINKSHGAVVSDVSISKENATGNNPNGVKSGEAFHGSSPHSTWRASASMLKPDTKLQNFFNYAKKGIKISDENVYDIPLKEKGDADKSQTRYSLIGDQLFLFDDGSMESSGRRYSLTEEKESDGVFKFIDPRSMSDKEKQERGENLRTAKAISVKPEQIVATKEKSARKVAEEWWDNNVGEPKFYETEIGVVEINRNSVESSLAHRYSQKKLDAITSLSDGFSNAVYLGTLPDGMRQEGVKNHYFAYPILYDGKRNYVFCRALHDNNTNRLYVHEVFLEEGIEKGNTLQTAASQPHGGISLYRDILANVLVSDSKSNNKNLNTKENSDNSQRFSLPDDERRAEEEKNASAVHDAMSHRGLREIVGEEGYDAFLDDVGRRLRDDVKKEVSSSVGREFLDDVLGVATNAQHTGRGRSYEARRRDTVGLTIGLLLERIW